VRIEKKEAICIGGLALQQQATKAVGRKYTKNFLRKFTMRYQVLSFLPESWENEVNVYS